MKTTMLVVMISTLRFDFAHFRHLAAFKSSGPFMSGMDLQLMSVLLLCLTFDDPHYL